MGFDSLAGNQINFYQYMKKIVSTLRRFFEDRFRRGLLVERKIDPRKFVVGSKIRISSAGVEGYIARIQGDRWIICNKDIRIESAGNDFDDMNKIMDTYIKTVMDPGLVCTLFSGMGYESSGIEIIKEEKIPDVLRFAVGSPENIQSFVWRVWVQGDDVYIGARNALQVFKVSLHASGIWRIAFVKELKKEDSNSDRVIVRWNKPAESPLGGSLV